MKTFNSREDAKKEARKMRGWKTRVIKTESGFVIRCNGVKYLMADGFVR